MDSSILTLILLVPLAGAVLVALLPDRSKIPAWLALITTLARMNGKVVGIVANNPMVNGGAMDVKAARKQTHFITLCDTFHIPLVFLVDVPGFMVGLQAEQAATLREGMRSVYTALQATVPMLTVVIRKCYGMATAKTCPHDPKDHISISGTQQREMLSTDAPIPPEFSRPEVVAILKEYYTGLRAADRAS